MPRRSGSLSCGWRESTSFFAEAVSELGRATRSQHDHPVREVREVVGSFSMPQITQGFLDCVLRFRLSYVDNVVVFGYVAEMRMVFLTISSRYPNLMLVRIAVEPAISEIKPEQPELPHMI